MNSIIVNGEHPLFGEVTIQGSKNAALPIIAATVLNKGITTIYNCPRIADIYYMLRILQFNGCVVQFKDAVLTIDASKCDGYRIPVEYADKMRSSITLLGALLGRNKHAETPQPGGCVIGARPIDLHIGALKQMNISFKTDGQFLYAKTDGIKGATIRLKRKSVGATENIILAAVLAEGRTQIYGAAREPEIVALCDFLKKAGARISGEGTDYIIIDGVSDLNSTQYSVQPDRIVAGTYCLAAVATRGQIVLQECPHHHLVALMQVLNKMGVRAEREKQKLYLDARRANASIPYLVTSEYPGFPTDLQSQLMSVLSIANGRSVIRENIFEERYKVAAQLRMMGASIRISENEAYIDGVESLTGCQVTAEELRGGAALVIAGLAAKGRTVIQNAHFIARGYENIVGDLKKLGAYIEAG